MRKILNLFIFTMVTACGTPAADGANGRNCTVKDNGNATVTLTCTDGTNETFAAGANGEDGAAGDDGATGPNGLPGEAGVDGSNGKDGRDCTVEDNGDGTATIICTDGTRTIIGVNVDTGQNSTGGNGGGCFGSATDLLISEYIEGSSDNKAIEIFNGTSETINIGSYSLKKGVNGGNLATMVNLSGTLEPGESYVVCNGQASDAIKDQCDQESGTISFNGDDAVALVKAGSTTIDVIGQIGQDPGSEWTVSPGGATKDFTLVRKNTIEAGSTNWSTGSGEWDVYPQDTTFYLGTHGFECD
jgi:hypothetical protein